MAHPGHHCCWGSPAALGHTAEPELGVAEGLGAGGALTLWYGSPEVRMILPSCLATCARGKTDQ